AGDTRSSIAKRYAVTVAALVDANHLKSRDAPLRIGQRLKIPDTPATRTSTAGSGPAHPVVRTVARAPLRPPSNLTLGVPDFDHLRHMPLFSWPVEGPIISTFGLRRSGWHRGVDVQVGLGSSCRAAAARGCV